MDALVEQYASGLEEAILAFAGRLDPNEMAESLYYENSDFTAALDVVFSTLDIDTLTVDKILLFNGIFTKSLLQVEESEGGGPKEPTLLLAQTLLLLDSSIYLSFVKYSGLNPVPMQTLNSIMLLSPTDFVVDTFGPVFFSHGSVDRRLKLTLHNTLVGKAKPGSTLLQIGNVLLPRLLGQLESHDIFAAQLMVFITNAFDINDKLLLTSDWKLNDFNKTYLEFSKSRKWPSNANRNPARRTNDAFQEYMVLALYFTTDFKRLVEELNAHRGGRYSKTGLPLIDNCKKLVKTIKEMDAQEPAPKLGSMHELTAEEHSQLVDSFAAKEYECDWLLNADEFGVQLRQPSRRWAVIFQIYVMVSFIYDLTDAKWTKVLGDINAKYKKFRKPEFDAMLANDSVKSQLVEVLTEIERHYASYFPAFHRILKHVVDNTEIRWRALKLKQFNHENLADLEALSNNKKRKLDEHLDKEPEIKAPYTYKLGTAKLSQIWSVKTGLTEIERKLADPQELLENYKDELYFVEGSLQSGEKSEELLEKQELLTWKKQRLERGLGGWLSL
ncbi:hypothetical protein KL942_002407 [Ogataea angusta]|uniref:Uncharacterized protein n=1 Tax=Pichia angusta TaxID=870730 RepID=A0ABQ7RZ49_PICAN|nr:hypothetical protein KL909_002307 [Ogataea angusta]KAG7840456.1 hypothetical protein KL942_002407 [Ogataea angusta]KAG7848836.1 hypothetical protein KL941_001654 [Ogataea angusta]KAG7850364.1 hypothetical protein KL940_001924 [Ogataea angusta]KAG7860371.1 hypothetical protein KL939_001857 [Ogataea angusta]